MSIVNIAAPTMAQVAEGSVAERAADVILSARRRSGAKRNLIEGTILGVVLTALSYLVGLGAGWIHSVGLLEAFAVFTSYVCTYLCVKERRINYPIGAVSTAAYCVLFYRQGLLASTVLNAYLTPSLLYGWYRWRNDEATRPVTRVSLKWIPVYAIVTAAAYTGAYLIVKGFDGALLWTDSAILIGSVLAQFLLDNKKIENWYVWMVVNGFAIYTYATAGLALAAFQYVFFLLNTVYGLIVWNRSRNDKSLDANDSVAAHQGTPALNPVHG
jgi:nicotinamide mononucleotide transporter